MWSPGSTGPPGLAWIGHGSASRGVMSANYTSDLMYNEPDVGLAGGLARQARESSVTPDELNRRRDEVQIVDVRWADEWDAGHLEGSVHLPQDGLDDRLGELDRDRPVVAVCRTGSRSAATAEQLRAEGFDAQNLEGGACGLDRRGHAVHGPGRRARTAGRRPA
ncbi:MAG: rhodanese-like domain-containing protein [Acidimicrobiales bacterium]